MYQPILISAYGYAPKIQYHGTFNNMVNTGRYNIIYLESVQYPLGIQFFFNCLILTGIDLGRSRSDPDVIHQ